MKKINGVLFWILSLTWGLPMTLVGALVALALLITGHKPKRFQHFIYLKLGIIGADLRSADSSLWINTQANAQNATRLDTEYRILSWGR